MIHEPLSRMPADVLLHPGEPLTTLELTVLAIKLRNGQHRAVKAAVRARSLSKVWHMIRLRNELADLEDAVNQTLAWRT